MNTKKGKRNACLNRTTQYMCKNYPPPPTHTFIFIFIFSTNKERNENELVFSWFTCRKILLTGDNKLLQSTAADV